MKSHIRTDRAKRRKAEQDPWDLAIGCFGMILLISFCYGVAFAAVIALVVWLCMNGLWLVAVGALLAIFIGLPLTFSLRRRMRRRH